jgi:hypothetical protein
MVGGVLLRFVLPAAAALFTAACVALRLPHATSRFGALLALFTTRGSVAATCAAGLIVAAALPPAAAGSRLRLRWLGLRRSPLPLRLPGLLPATLLPTATLRFAAALLRFADAPALLFAGGPAMRPFVAATPLSGAFGALLGMAARVPLPVGFRVGAGDRDVGQGKRKADRNRDPMSASVSRAARHGPARLRVPRRARERS